MLVVNNRTKLRMLTNFIRGPLNNRTLRLKLYSNNFTPVTTSMVGDLTETTGGGYTDKILGASDWEFMMAQSLTGYKYALGKTAFQQVFNFSSTGATVYGWYVTDAGSGDLLFAERFANVPFISQENSFVRFTPNITLF